jgi:GPH family glycoside/pentoside/hexuronide:cation symporter
MQTEGKMEKSNAQQISFREKFIYGTGDIGLNAMYTLFSSYVMYFYTDVILMNAALIGTVIMVCKIMDGISDIIAGQLIDKHRQKGGHCIPVLAKWSLPMLLSVVLVFLVPDSTVAVRVAFILVTYNLFNTVMYTYVGLAHQTLPTYVTNDPVSRSQMFCYKMLFAAITQTIMASTILPMVKFFGGQTVQSAWVKSILVFGAVGLVFLYLNVFFVKERVENAAPSQNIWVGLKAAFSNKYWIMAVFISFFTNVVLMFNLSISVYYLNSVVGNMGLMGAYVAASNLPGVVLMFIIPMMLKKFSTKRLIIFGTSLMLIAQVIFLVSPVSSIPMLIGTALLRGIGFAFPMGLCSALIGDTIDYGEWKTGVQAQAMLFSASTLTGKIGQGLLTSCFGIFLTAVGYNGALKTQAAGTLSGITEFFKVGPLVVISLILVIMCFWNLDKDLPSIRAELEKRRKAL